MLDCTGEFGGYKAFQAHFTEIYGLEFAPQTTKYPSENIILTCCKDATIHLIDISKELLICQFVYIATPPPETCDVSWRNDGFAIAVASLDGTVTIWEIDSEIQKNIQKAAAFSAEKKKSRFRRLDR